MSNSNFGSSAPKYTDGIGAGLAGAGGPPLPSGNGKPAPTLSPLGEGRLKEKVPWWMQPALPAPAGQSAAPGGTIYGPTYLIASDGGAAGGGGCECDDDGGDAWDPRIDPSPNDQLPSGPVGPRRRPPHHRHRHCGGGSSRYIDVPGPIGAQLVGGSQMVEGPIYIPPAVAASSPTHRTPPLRESAPSVLSAAQAGFPHQRADGGWAPQIGPRGSLAVHMPAPAPSRAGRPSAALTRRQSPSGATGGALALNPMTPQSFTAGDGAGTSGGSVGGRVSGRGSAGYGVMPNLLPGMDYDGPPGGSVGGGLEPGLPSSHGYGGISAGPGGGEPNSPWGQGQPDVPTGVPADPGASGGGVAPWGGSGGWGPGFGPWGPYGPGMGGPPPPGGPWNGAGWGPGGDPAADPLPGGVDDPFAVNNYYRPWTGDPAGDPNSLVPPVSYGGVWQGPIGGMPRLGGNPAGEPGSPASPGSAPVTQDEIDNELAWIQMLKNRGIGPGGDPAGAPLITDPPPKPDPDIQFPAPGVTVTTTIQNPNNQPTSTTTSSSSSAAQQPDQSPTPASAETIGTIAPDSIGPRGRQDFNHVETALAAAMQRTYPKSRASHAEVSVYVVRNGDNGKYSYIYNWGLPNTNTVQPGPRPPNTVFVAHSHTDWDPRGVKPGDPVDWNNNFGVAGQGGIIGGRESDLMQILSLSEASNQSIGVALFTPGGQLLILPGNGKNGKSYRVPVFDALTHEPMFFDQPAQFDINRFSPYHLPLWNPPDPEDFIQRVDN